MAQFNTWPKLAKHWPDWPGPNRLSTWNRWLAWLARM